MNEKNQTPFDMSQYAFSPKVELKMKILIYSLLDEVFKFFNKFQQTNSKKKPEKKVAEKIEFISEYDRKVFEVMLGVIDDEDVLQDFYESIVFSEEKKVSFKKMEEQMQKYVDSKN